MLRYFLAAGGMELDPAWFRGTFSMLASGARARARTSELSFCQSGERRNDPKGSDTNSIPHLFPPIQAVSIQARRSIAEALRLASAPPRLLAMMNSSACLRSFSQLSLDRTAHASLTSRTLLAPQIACFSTTTSRSASVAKKKTTPTAPKRGEKTLRIKKGKNHEMGKRPDPGERKAQRKRIVLSNDNALEVSSLKDLSKDNVLSAEIEGKVMGFPENIVDALRAEEAFKPTQGWRLFRRPAALVRKETVQLAALLKEVEGAKDQNQPKTIRRVVSGDVMSGKTTLLLQGLAMAHLRDWFVVNLPEGT